MEGGGERQHVTQQISNSKLAGVSSSAVLTFRGMAAVCLHMRHMTTVCLRPPTASLRLKQEHPTAALALLTQVDNLVAAIEGLQLLLVLLGPGRPHGCVLLNAGCCWWWCCWVCEVLAQQTQHGQLHDSSLACACWR